MLKSEIVGTWKLESFEIEDTEKKISQWGKNTRGLLIYSESDQVSVNISKDVEVNSQNEAENVLDSILFYSGSYRVEGNLIRHQVTIASNPTRVGKEMLRYAEIDGDRVILTTPFESFGRAFLIWKRIGK